MPKSSTLTSEPVVVLRQKDVLGLEVAVDDPGGVGAADRRDHREHDRRRLLGAEALVAFQLPAERFAVE